MFYFLSSFPSPSSFPSANFNREVPISHASSAHRDNDDQGDPDDKTKKKKKKKKGRQTKIWTAKGVRDRRVRLSMEVSGKFFGLQDVLGFDTASDTLKWLISESSNAIEEVKHATEVQGKGTYTSPADDQAEKEARRECLAKARARARERTRAKRNHFNDGRNNCHSWSDFLP